VLPERGVLPAGATHNKETPLTPASLPRVTNAGAGEPVSWLEAAPSAFPGGYKLPSGQTSVASSAMLCGPLTVAGPRRFHTGFRVVRLRLF